MIKDEDFFSGNIGGSIGALIESHQGLFRVFRFILVTSLDSGTDLSKDKMILECGLPYKLVGKSALFESRHLEALVSMRGMFAGFDEVWALNEEPKAPKSEKATIVAPYKPAIPLRAAVKEWMSATKCKLGLGDGEGLNYVTPDESLARQIEAALSEK